MKIRLSSWSPVALPNTAPVAAPIAAPLPVLVVSQPVNKTPKRPLLKLICNSHVSPWQY